jgi:hypothetical protein
VKTQVLSRGQRRDLQGDTGEVAESIAADAYGYNPFVSADWYDAKRDSGAVIEVKSCLSRLASGAKGRFRVFKGQHEKLVREDRSGSSKYVFVLFDLDGEPTAKMVRKAPADIGRLVAGRGGFYSSGHNSQGKQHKIPISALF